MENPSNRTLVRGLRLGGAKRRFILAAAKHSCGTLKRPAGPIVSRLPHSFVFNDVVGLDLFFFKHERKAHLACHETSCVGALVCSVLFPCGISREKPCGTHTETIGCDHMEGPASLSSISSKASALAENRKRHPQRHRGGMLRQNMQGRIGMKTTTRQHKTAPKHRRGRILKRTAMP